ncbi:MAG: hypothetical protein SLAVMIC_00366 [uncultured marine phage]|uniref:Uncharacterized protein n=1 Tax=uncultured marine phage TaxID=707152 RepID=A0A8D9CF21_9VIRU|nr:MAG: hypothetical protein SLAVMIC_00366 [uncultured marine phage]
MSLKLYRHKLSDWEELLLLSHNGLDGVLVGVGDGVQYKDRDFFVGKYSRAWNGFVLDKSECSITIKLTSKNKSIFTDGDNIVFQDKSGINVKYVVIYKNKITSGDFEIINNERIGQLGSVNKITLKFPKRD